MPECMHSPQERIKLAQTSQFKAIFPNLVNHYDTLFGGMALSYMDEVAFITATRYSRQKYVTVSSDKIDFKCPIPSGTIIEIVGEVVHVGNSSIKINVSIYVEEMYCETRQKAVEGIFTLVAVDDMKRPVQIV